MVGSEAAPRKGTITRNFLSLFAGEAVSKILGFTATVYLARTLSVEVFGQLGFILAIFSYLVLAVNLGFETIGAREVARQKLAIPEIVQSIFILRLLTALGCILIVCLVLPALPLDGTERRMLFNFSLTLLLVPLYFQYYFQGTERMGPIAWSRILQSAFYMAAILFFVQTSSAVAWIPLFLGISIALSIFPLLALYVSRFGVFPFRASLGTMKTFFFAAIPIGVSAVLIQLYYNMDTVILGFMVSSREVGLYSASYKIVLLFTAVPPLILSVYFPALSQEQGRQYGSGIFRKYFFSLSAIGIPLGFAGYFIAEWLITLIFGKAYSGAVQPLQVLLVTASIIFLNVAFVNPLLAWGRQKEYMIVIATGAAVNVVMNLLLIPRFGILGAAIATLLAEIAVGLLGVRAYLKSSRGEVSFRRLFTHPFIASVLAFGITFAVSQILHSAAPVDFAVFLCVYAFYMFLVRGTLNKSLHIA